ncbi:PspC domain-containing protein [Pseudonocardia sp. KRD291]|uniref:PspC domain-containing protein n=1 Tax=Pseudonocardia sp. KRD291 TaxID=2792007 RepID=UPI001C49FA62|nr:PspC domain-containing protein [Pseudonocardia sp. KRD291]MBW0103529.1 PspC domain-containing protein [Pseudonocardia sp. KRD291]
MDETDDAGRRGGTGTDVRTPAGRARIRAELHDMWQTRPARPREDRKVAGVAAAIGQRYDIDPVLVRIGFVVASLYGPGIPLYLAGCAALPDAGSAHRAGRAQGAALGATVLVATAAVVSALVMLGADGRWFVPLLACMALLGGLHLTRGRRGPLERPAAGPAGSPAGSPAAEPATTGADAPTAVVGPATTVPGGGSGHPVPTAGSAPASVDLAAEDGTPTVPQAVPHAAATQAAGQPGADTAAGATAAVPTEQSTPPPVPPSWDPLGAAPFAWDLPDLGPEPGPPPAPRSRITLVTLGIALVAAGIAAVLALTAPGSLGVAAVPATALAVVGAGLVIGAFRHAGRWLIPFALVLAAATWVSTAVPWSQVRDGVGDISAAPRTAAALAPEYRRGAGTITLDLRGMDLTAAPGVPVTPVRTSAQLGVGTVTVLIPRNADLVARADAGIGDVTLDGRSVDGTPATMNATDPGPDGPGGRPIELDLHTGAGSLEVTRG